LVATIIQFFIGYLWYSKILFGKYFLKAIGKSEDELEMTPVNIIGPILIAFVEFLLYALLLDLFVSFDLSMSFLISNIAWAGFIATTNLYAVFFEERNLTLYLLNVGYQLVGLLIGALIIGLWK
jgi:hypothetical protein